MISTDEVRACCITISKIHGKRTLYDDALFIKYAISCSKVDFALKCSIVTKVLRN